MKDMLRFRLWLIAGMVVLLPGSAFRAQIDAGYGGTVEGQASVDRLRVIVESPDQSVQRVLQRAFSLHGGFELRSSGTVDFVFRFAPLPGNAVELTITSAGQELLRQRFGGRSLQEAVLKAADTAVQRTTNAPGFFSGTIAFISDRSGNPEVYVSDLLLQQPKRLTNDGVQCMLPALSPDGTQLLYTSYFRNGFPDLYAVDLATNQRKIFASFRGMNSGATFSPDGRQVAMVLSSSGNSEIYSANAMGGQFQRLTRTQALEADPAWSPDGRQIAFTSDELGRPQIYVMNADGSGRRRLPTNVSRNCSEPVWNPRNAQQIAFTAAVGSEFELCLYTMGSSEAKILTRGPGDAVEPVWLPDGRHILFTARSAATSQLAILDTVSGQQRMLTPTEWGRSSMSDYIPVLLP